MDFTANEDAVAFRREIREVLAATFTQDARARMHETGTYHDWGIHRAIAARGWLAAALPESLGGQGRDAEQLSALFQELEMAGAPYDGVSNAMMLGYILGQIGSDFHRAEIMPRLLNGNDVPCLGYSEPESGSDVAAASTRAVRDGADWVIDGQKMFTSVAEEATWAFLLTRTNTEAAKHRGLTFFLVDMRLPGVEIREMRTMSGKRTNVTFYDGVRVPDAYRVGDVDGGWEVMRVALSFERGIAGGVSGALQLFEDALEYVRGTFDAQGRPRSDDPLVRERLVRVAIDNEVTELLAQRAAWVALAGQLPGQEGAECKLFATEAFTRATETLLALLGPDGLRSGAHSPAQGRIEHAFRFAPVTTIWGGTSEIQKNLVAERGLGLPRQR
jgi:alkylation response protein AidB-like acyl-CoA dehydrogenase